MSKYNGTTLESASSPRPYSQTRHPQHGFPETDVCVVLVGGNHRCKTYGVIHARGTELDTCTETQMYLFDFIGNRALPPLRAEPVCILVMFYF